MRKMLMLAMCTAVGCGGDGTGGIEIEFVAESDTEGALTLSDTIEVTRLEVQLREIKILPDDSNVDASKVKIKDLFVMDLVDPDGGTMPALDLEPGLYKKVEFKVAKPHDGEGIDGSEWAMWFEGSKGGVSFRYLDDALDKITLRDQDGIELEEGNTESFLVDLHVPGWFNGVDVDDLAVTDGVAVIEDHGDNRDAHEQIEHNIKSAIKLLRHP